MKKEERRAYDKAIAQYTSEINKIKPVQEIKRVDANVTRSFENELGGNASGRLNYLSKKADSVARTINKDDDYKNKVGLFNERYKVLKDQVAGKYTTRYAVRDSAVVSDSKKSSNNSGILGTIASPGPTERFDFSNTFSTREDALKEAKAKADAYNNNAENFKPRQVKETGPYGIVNVSTVINPKVTAEQYMQDVTYKGGASGRTERFNALDEGYQDMAKLSGDVKNSTGNQNISAYSALTDKLKQQYKRDAGNVTNIAKPTGLLSSELTGNPLAGEVIS